MAGTAQCARNNIKVAKILLSGDIKKVNQSTERLFLVIMCAMSKIKMGNGMESAWQE